MGEQLTAGVADRAGPPGDTPLRGRPGQLSLITEALRQARNGRGATIFLEGGPGFGKTRLLDEAAAIATRFGVEVGRGAVAARDARVPMGALMQALFDGSPPLVSGDARANLHYLPEQRYWLLDEIEGLLEAVALRSPLLLCLDDMHWGTAACLTAVRTLPVRLAGLPLVWLFAYRGGREARTLRPAVDDLVRSGASRSVLGPLDPDAVTEVVADVMGARPDHGLLQLTAEAAGSPFLLVELLHGLRDERLVRIEDGRAVLLGRRLPARVRDTMQDRLDRLSAMAGHIAQVACVLARRFSFDQLARMVDVAPATLLAPVNELLAADILRPDDDALAFRHDLIREAVRDILPVSAHRALARQAVSVLLATGASPVEVAVQLAASATRGDAAAVQTLRDAARALAETDPSTAADLCKSALSLTGGKDDIRGALAAETAVLLHLAGRAGEGKEFVEDVLREALPPEQEADVRLSIAGMFSISPDTRAEAGERALARPGLSATMRARHTAYLVHNYVVAGRVSEAARLLAGARGEVSASGDAIAAYALDLAECGLSYYRDHLVGALDKIDATVRNPAGRLAGPRETLAREWYSELLILNDRFDESLRWTVDNLRAAQRDRQGWAARLWEGVRGRQLVQLGRLADGAAALEDVADTTGDVEMVGVLESAVVLTLGRVAIHTGDRPRLRRCLNTLRPMLTGGPLSLRRHAAWLHALEAAARGDYPAARGHLSMLDPAGRIAVVPTFPCDVTDEVGVVRIAMAVGDDALVESAVASAAYRARSNPDVATIQGCAAHARGLAGGGLDDLRDAVAMLERSPRPMALASALEDTGAATGRDEAVAMYDRALELYTHAGASWDAYRVRGRLRKLGIRRRLVACERPAHGWDALTDSELQVVRRVAEGLTNRAVAEQLFLSPHTVSTHLRHAFTKLDINSRTELARIVAKHSAETPE